MNAALTCGFYPSRYYRQFVARERNSTQYGYNYYLKYKTPRNFIYPKGANIIKIFFKE